MKKIILILLCLVGIFNLNAQTTITVGTASIVSGNTDSSPINIYYRSHHCQILYTPADINGAGWGAAGIISKLGFNIYGTTTEALPNFSIKLKNTTSTNVNTYDAAGLNTVYSSASYFPVAGGFELLTLDNNFIWDGTSNLLVDICFDQVSAYTSTGEVYMYPYTNSGAEYSYVREDNSAVCAISTNSGNSGFNYANKPQIQFELTALPPCTGSPTAGDAISTSTNVCANTPFSLSLINNSINSGLAYQWQSSPNGTAWTNLGSVQQSSLYTIGALSSATYYQCVTTCTSSASSATSTPVLVNLNPLINCYCTPNYVLDCSYGDKFSDFSLANVVFQPSNCDFNGYSDSTTSAYTVINLNAGSTYSLQANISNSGFAGDMVAGAWIDFDQNGIFDTNEYTYLGYGGTQIYSNTLMVPITAPSGLVRMRLKLDANYANASTQLDPCNNNNGAYYGQILDYKVNITAAPACSGTPNAGDATSTQTTVCQNQAYVLDLINNSVASNITYQWQSSPNGTAWSNLGSSQNTIPYSITTQSASTYYRCITTCTISSQTATSTPILIIQNTIANCYCTPTPVNCSSSQITNITFETMTDNPTCGLNGYSDNTSSVSTVSLSANQTYTIAIDINAQSGSGYVGFWIDYNQDGVFDSNEYNFVGSTSLGTTTANVTVPFTAIGGNTRMRVKMEVAWSSFGGLNPCSNNEYDGQTLDYLINITPSSPCSGAPNAGDATAPISAVCENVAFTLDLANNDLVSNISYQWQSSPDNVIWTNIGSPQTNVPYTITSQSVTMHYRCLTTCTTSALTSTSSPWAIIQNPVTACYCIPEPTDCMGGDEIKYVVFETIANASSCDGLDGYSDYTGSVSSATIVAGQSYTLTTVLGYMFGEHVYAWIDYDQNGVFDSSEYTDLGANSGNDTIVNTINIPPTALAGNTRMRVRNFSGFGLSSSDACNSPSGGSRLQSPISVNGANAYGETEDYMVNILPPDCGSINFPPTISISGATNLCPSQATTLDISATIPVATGITYQWKESTGGSYANVGANADNFNAMPASNSSYYCEIYCNAAPIRNSDTIFVNINIVTIAPSTTSVTCNGLCNGSITLNANSTGLSGFTYTINPAIGSFTSGIATNLCANIYTVDVMNSIGCSANTQTIVIAEPSVLTAVPSQTDITCNGLNNGIATVTVTGGVSPLNFSWLPSGGTALSANNLSAGNYTFNISDGNGCTLNQTVSISEPSSLTVTVTNVQGSCVGGASGQAEMLVSGGTSGYNYSWTSGGSNQLEINLPVGTQTCTITDANLCTITETVAINASVANYSVVISGVSSICEQLEDSVTSNITGGSGSFSYSWLELPTNATSVNPNFTYTASVGTYSYNLTVTDNVSNCIVNSNTLALVVNPSSNFSGTVTTNPNLPVAGRVVLYKYLPFYTKFDSVAGQNIGAAGDFLFNSFNSGTYIIKAIPTSPLLQIAYGDSAINWKTAKQIIHGCSVNDVQNINVKALSTFTTTGTGSLSGQITEGFGFGQKMGFGAKPAVPGTPIGGIIVKGGKNPGGQMFVQTLTDPTTGTYTLSGLPANTGNESYFILVDIPGLDTNNTYHRVINLTNNNFQGLDFVVDSAKINPVQSAVISVHDISAIENQIKVFPNPASNNVTIQYNLQNSSLVKIELFDMLGKSVKILLPETQQSMEMHKKSWQIDDVRAGLYFIKMIINGSESTIKLSITN